MRADWRRLLRLWSPPLIGIPVMLVLGLSIREVGYLLFGHHLFWIFGIILLINPVTETFWSSPKSRKRRKQPPQASKMAQERAQARKRTARKKPAPGSVTPAGRLARLLKQKQAVDQQIEKLATKEKERVE